MHSLEARTAIPVDPATQGGCLTLPHQWASHGVASGQVVAYGEAKSQTERPLGLRLPNSVLNHLILTR